MGAVMHIDPARSSAADSSSNLEAIALRGKIGIPVFVETPLRTEPGSGRLAILTLQMPQSGR